MTHVDLNRTAKRAPQPVDRDTVPQAPVPSGGTGESVPGRGRPCGTSSTAEPCSRGASPCFTILVTGAAVTASLLFLVIGVFVWIGFVHVLRWTTWIDRKLAGWQRHERVPAVYRRPTDRGFIPYLRMLSSDPQTWKDMAWLGVTSIIGFAGGLAVITAAGLAATYVSMPLWYWAASHPDKEYGVTNLGFLTVDTLGEAGIAAAIGLVLIPFVLLLARWCAATHAALAVRLLAEDTTS